jgi:hypothetical protein
MSIKASRFYGIGLALLAAGTFAACSSDPDPGTGGAAGTPGTGGTTGTAGTGATAGSGTAGTATTAGTGSGGAGTAGSGIGGSGGGGSVNACKGTKPTSNVISSFGDLVAGSSGQLTFMAGIPGGSFTYPTTAIKAADSGMALNIKGNVGTYSGFGVYLNDCADMSLYTGVSFSIKGNVGGSGALNFRVQLNSDTPVDNANKKGTCVAADPMDTYASCHHPAIDITGITADGKTVMINFTDLTGGKPNLAVDPKEIVGFEWAFTYPDVSAGGSGGSGTGGATGGSGGSGGSAAGSGGTGGDGGGTSAGAGGAVGGSASGYPIDVTIDDFMLLGGPAGGSGGSGGGSGGAAAGSGGAAAGSGGAAAGSGGSGGSGGAAAGSGGSGGNP